MAEMIEKYERLQAIIRALKLPNGVTIRPWEEADFLAIQRLSEAEGWPTPLERPEEALQAWRHSWPALVAVADQSVIGFCRALSDGAVTTYVAEVLVAPAWRGQGIASALLEASQRLYPGSRLDLLALPTSRSFYEGAGFRPFAGFRLSWPEREEHR
ncbi:MAG TPA: GNAT family N-acetyltransferase [Ktedonobacterales bacterium]